MPQPLQTQRPGQPQQPLRQPLQPQQQRLYLQLSDPSDASRTRSDILRRHHLFDPESEHQLFHPVSQSISSSATPAATSSATTATAAAAEGAPSAPTAVLVSADLEDLQHDTEEPVLAAMNAMQVASGYVSDHDEDLLDLGSQESGHHETEVLIYTYLCIP